jgi:hypothetical protein
MCKTQQPILSLGRILFLLWFLALLPRLVFTFIFIDEDIFLDDMFQYDMLARSMSSGNGYRWYSAEDIETLRPYLSSFLDISEIEVPEEGITTTHRAPGYPLLLTVIYLLVSEENRFAVVRLLQAGLAATMAPLSFLLALKLGIRRREASLGGIGMAFYPILLLYPVGLASENLFIPILLASFLALVWAVEGSDWHRFVLAGLLLGIAILTRSIITPFVLLAIVWLAVFSKSGWKGAALCGLAALGVCLPWMVRNSIVMGRPSFVENSLGYNLFIGYHPKGDGNFVSDVAIIPYTILDDAEREAFCLEAALGFIRSDPSGSLSRVFPRAREFFAVEDRELVYAYTNGLIGYIPQPWLGVIYLFLASSWMGLVVFGLFGLTLSGRRPITWLAWALIGAYSLPHLFILAEPRFHLLLVPFLMSFAAYGWSRWHEIIPLLSPLRSPNAWKTGMIYAGLFVLVGLWVWGYTGRWEVLMAAMGPEGHLLRYNY